MTPAEMSSSATTFKLKAFAEWIEANGGFIEQTKGEWEVLRYTFTGKPPRILYRNKTGNLTLTKEVSADCQSFLSVFGKTGPDAVKKIARQKTLPLRKKVAERDFPNGNPTCCYCDQFITLEDVTFEHFLPIKKGGPNHIHNGALSCQPCNVAMGSEDVYTKILWRDKIQNIVAQTPPWEKFNAKEIEFSK